MVRRRDPAPVHDPQRSAELIQASLAHLLGRFEQMADDVDGRLGRIEKDVATGSLGQERLRSEMAEGRRDTGELRDGLSRLREQVEQLQKEGPTQVAESAAHGAAQGAMESAAPMAEAIKKASSTTPLQRWGAVGVILLVLVQVVRDGPNLIRFVDGLWAFMKGLNP